MDIGFDMAQILALVSTLAYAAGALLMVAMGGYRLRLLCMRRRTG
jgi:hypothetical protein